MTVSIQQPAPNFFQLNESKQYHVNSGSQARNYILLIDGSAAQNFKD